MTNIQEVLVGEIIGSHGLKGWVQVFSYTRPAEKILAYSPWQLTDATESEEVLISSSRVVGKKILVLFKECVSRNQADGFRARKVFIDKSQMPELEEGDFYWNELVGMKVKTTQGISERIILLMAFAILTFVCDIVKFKIPSFSVFAEIFGFITIYNSK